MQAPMYWQLVPGGSTLNISVSLGTTQNATVDGIVKDSKGNSSSISSAQLIPGPYRLSLGASLHYFVMIDATFLNGAGGSATVTASVVDPSGSLVGGKALTRTLMRTAPGHDEVTISVDTV